jgi:hypothetical protein
MPPGAARAPFTQRQLAPGSRLMRKRHVFRLTRLRLQ